MVKPRRDEPGEQDDPQIKVTHFIPSVQLKGRREDKIQALNILIDHLEGLRRSLIERSPEPREWREEPAMQLTLSDRWWAVGLLAAAVLVLVILDARACVGTNDVRFSARPPSRMARSLPR